MTPDEVFAKLRDIHLPVRDAVTESGPLDPRPLVAFAIAAVVVLALQRWTAARRIGRALARIDRATPPAAQRDAIACLIQAWPVTRRGAPPPPSMFLAPDDLTAEHVSELRTWARRRCG